MYRSIAIALIFFLLLLISGCEISTTVSVNSKNPPSFNIHGSGGIYFLRVVDITTCKKSLDECPKLWEVKPVKSGYIKDLPVITYGKVPEGFQQIFPENNTPLPVLIEGKIYSVWTPTYGANGGGKNFIIKDGKSIEF